MSTVRRWDRPSSFGLKSCRPMPGGAILEDGRWGIGWFGTALMGVVNVTPDSFSDGGKHASTRAAVAHGRAAHAAGALIVDVGGESTRPGATAVSIDTELERVLPVITGLRTLPTLISIDTRHAAVARRAIIAGAHVVNDVSGLRDPEMLAVCAELGVPVIIGHMQGEPATMQLAPHYDDVVAEVGGHLRARAEEALAAGVPSVMIDPGIGFGKTTEHNVQLLRGLDDLGPFPLVIGASRKGLIDRLADAPDPGKRLPGTLAIHLWAALHGAAIVRTHDVAEHRQALAVLAALVDDPAGNLSRPTDRAASNPVSGLTPQQRRVAKLLASGCSNREIADELALSIETVKTHLRRVYAQLGVRNRTEAAIALSGRSARLGVAPGISGSD